MNYEQARQIGPSGPAPGKWNWSNANDSVAPTPFTIAPCINDGVRCDHDTQEEAERHHWRYELGRVQLHKIDLDGARQRNRCDVPECPNWESYRTRWPDGYRSDSLCEEHATHQMVVALHPFEPDMQVIHS